MTWLFLRPTDSLLFRDGRSFDSSNLASTMPWPMPQVFVGALRSKLGRSLGFNWRFGQAEADVLALLGNASAPGSGRVKSMWFARQDSVSQDVELLVPRPADLVRFAARKPDWRGRVNAWQDHPLRPMRVDGVTVAPPKGLGNGLAPLVHAPAPHGDKPIMGEELPRFASFERVQGWLSEPGAGPEPVTREDETPLIEEQVHLKRSRHTRTGVDAMLFSTRRIAMPRGGPTGIWKHGFVLEIEGVEGQTHHLEGVWRLGGKGGSALAEVLPAAPCTFQDLRDESTRAAAASDGRIRWILTSPARFSRGWVPDFIGPDGTGEFPRVDARVRLVAAAQDRPIAYSGWDLQAGRPDHRASGAPRATRLFVPPGATYFFEVVAETTERRRDAAVEIASAHALAPLCKGKDQVIDEDAAIDFASGLGAGVFGAWDWYPADAA